jgi:hypothetical protein
MKCVYQLVISFNALEIYNQPITTHLRIWRVRGNLNILLQIIIGGKMKYTATKSVTSPSLKVIAHKKMKKYGNKIRVC